MARPRSCHCGQCKRCKDAARKKAQYDAWTPAQRRAWIARKNQVKLYLNRRRQRRRHVARNPQKVAARKAVAHAIEAGKLKRQACEICGAVNAQAHHDDYSRPLDVRWLCRTHHKAHEKIGGR